MSSNMLSAYALHRSTEGPLPEGSAPCVVSSSYKIQEPADTPLAKRWDHRFSSEGNRRTSSTLKGSSKTLDPAAIISLGTARPAPRYYPWQSFVTEARDSNHLHGCQEKSMVTMTCHKGEEAYDLGLALNYGYAAGSPQLLRFITEHVQMIHQPQYDDWEVSLTCGTTSAIEIVLRMLCNRGDFVLAEAFTYPGTTEAAKALGVNMVAIGMDEGGLIPEDLDSKLSNWQHTKGPKPSLLYTIPTGQNPTGISQSIERRRAIYQVAEKHDLLILEDDPYYFIQLMREANTDGVTRSLPVQQGERYLQRLPPSFLSLDTSGRVLRLDATSKILAPGLRCGWITGCSQLIAKFINYTEMSTVAPSGPSQAMLYKLLDETWGHAGFMNWLEHLSSQYQDRLETLIAACNQHLPLSICSWTVPTAGMFLWIRVAWSQHPAALLAASSHESYHDVLKIEDQIYQTARAQGVLVSKGSWFAAEPGTVQELYFRLTFASAVDGDLLIAVERFGKALCDEFMLVSC